MGLDLGRKCVMDFVAVLMALWGLGWREAGINESMGDYWIPMWDYDGLNT